MFTHELRAASLLGAAALLSLGTSCSSPANRGVGTQPATFFNDSGQGKEDGGDEIDGCEVVVRPQPPGEIGGGGMTTESLTYSLVQVSGSTGLDASITDAGKAEKLFTLQPGQQAILSVSGLDVGQPTLHYTLGDQQGSRDLDPVTATGLAESGGPTAMIRTNQLNAKNQPDVPEGLWIVDGGFAAVLELDASK